MKLVSTLAIAAGATAVTAASPAISQNGPQEYKVTIENLTKGQVLSRGVIATHSKDVHLFQPGEAPSEGIMGIAEDGDPEQAMKEVEDMMGHGVTDAVMIGKPIMRQGTDKPSQASFTISANEGDVISFASMLNCTNDGFTGLHGAPLNGETEEMQLGAFDAGSETNNELFNSIVDGCGKAGPVKAEADGNIDDLPDDGMVIGEHKGLQLVGDLTEAHAWGESPVARVTIQPAGQ